ncbi:MAG TPA: C45 family autoproteolytic acyltransferase/hydrolase [Bryobacteraceae bacterium]|nr:C45 family autoproteolytic acyltransferase/hydrolase [Bryobacteraceae bacterium]
MRKIALALLSLSALFGAPPYQASLDAAHWHAQRGLAAPDNQVQREGHASLRVEPNGISDACVLSTPVTLTIGKSYELSGWMHTDKLDVRDTDRSPIATGASIGMASMPWDVHSESLGGTRGWTHVSLRFMATRADDQVVLNVAGGGAFTGKAWFEGISIEEVAQSGVLPQKAALRTFGPGYRYPRAGWLYVHIEGAPYDRGYQHGYLLAREIEQYIDRCAAQLDARSKATAWNNGRTAANALFLRGFDKEILTEMKGIADGAAAAGAKVNGRTIDLIDVVTLNTITELGELQSAMPMTPSGLEGLNLMKPRYDASKTDVPVTARCSAFAATGKATRDGKMVIGHVTMWPLTLAEQTNIMLDVVPTEGHRVLMQSYPGGIQSGTDWYQNDVGVVLTETTIRQSPFNMEGTPVAYRARKAIQYGDSVQKVAELLSTRNNGLYTNEWLVGDGRTNEIAMLELGTYKTKLYSSAKNQWFGGTEGFYWGCNNAKDLNVRLEYVPDPHGEPEDLPFVPASRDIKWQEMYRQYKGRMDEGFAALAFRTAPLVSSTTMDAKITNSDMANRMMTWALFGKPNQREWVPSAWQKEQYSGNDGLYSSGYRLFEGHPADAIKMLLDGAPKASAITAQTANAEEGGGRGGRRGRATSSNDKLWKGWILPASDADVWLTAGAAAYHSVAGAKDADKQIEAFRAQYREAALEGEQPLSKLSSSTTSANWHTLAEAKGVLLLDALRRAMGDDAFYALMKDFFDKGTTKTVHAADFVAAAGAAQQPLFAKWLDGTGLPEAGEGAIYVAGDLHRKLASTIIVYGTVTEAGANRYAAEQWQKQFLDQFESAVRIYKDFEVTERELSDHDVLFVGRPETNSALAAWTKPLELNYDGVVFQLAGKDHSSENDALVLSAANPMNRKHMVLIAAGNSPLGTVLLTHGGFGRTQYQLYDAGRPGESGFLTK